MSDLGVSPPGRKRPERGALPPITNPTNLHRRAVPGRGGLICLERGANEIAGDVDDLGNAKGDSDLHKFRYRFTNTGSLRPRNI